MADPELKLSSVHLLASPANFLALMGGAGLAPKAPGTFGTLAAIPVFLLMPQGLLVYGLLVIALFLVGVWCCGACAQKLGVHDHGGIVWDEMVGYLITMAALPASPVLIIAGFVLFRVFDILKPWPIGWVDRQVHGGLGIMLDDVLAGVMAAVVLQVGWRFLGSG